MASNPLNTLTGLPVAAQAWATAILGPVYCGWMLQIFLFGYVVNEYLRYTNSPSYVRDSTKINLLLHTVMLLASIQTSFNVWSVYHYATDQHRDIDTLFAQTVLDSLLTVATGFEGSLVQLYLAHRASALFENIIYKRIFYAFILMGVSSGLTGALLWVVISFYSRAGKSTSITFYATSAIWLWSAAFTDVLITTTLCMMLRKRIVGFNASTDSRLRQIMRLALETASYTAMGAFIGAMLSSIFSADVQYNSNTAFAFWVPLTSFYALSLVTTLSSREKFREQDAQKDGMVEVFESGFVSRHTVPLSPREAVVNPTPDSGVGLSLKPEVPKSDDGKMV